MNTQINNNNIEMVDIDVVVDYQNDFVIGSLGFKGAEVLDEGIRAETWQCLEDGGVVFATLDTHFNDYMETREGKNLPIVHTVDKTIGHQLYGETGEYLRYKAKEDPDRVKFIKKTTFGSADLINALRNKITMLQTQGKQVRRVRLMGVVTNICVISNAVATIMAVADLKPIVDVEVLAYLCGSNDWEMHEKALEVMESFQVKVIRETK